MARKASPSRRELPSLEQLAQFRYQLRRFLRFSEQAARSSGLTPQQHQLLLGVAGFTGRGWATISELAEFLQERHNAVVGLVQRAERHGYLRKGHPASDHRFVRVCLLPKGARLLRKLTQLHARELRRFQNGLLAKGAPRPVELRPGAGRLRNQRASTPASRGAQG